MELDSEGNGIIWITLFNGGTIYWNYTSGEKLEYSPVSDIFCFSSLLLSESNILLIGSPEGIVKFNIYTREYDFSSPIGVSNSLCMVELPDEIIVGSFENAIYRINK